MRLLDELLRRGADPLQTYDGKTAVDNLLAVLRKIARPKHIDRKVQGTATNFLGDMIGSVTQAMHARATAARAGRRRPGQ